MTDATHDPTRLSWVASANGHAEFPIQNLPFGVFSTHDGVPRGGVAIGNSILDIGAALEAGLFAGTARDAAEAAVGPCSIRCWRCPRFRARRYAGDCPIFLRPTAMCVAWRRACCMMPPRAQCTCRRRSAITRTSSPASITRARAVRSPARQSADAELQVCARRLSRPRFVGATIGRGCAAPERPAKLRCRTGADVRAVPQSRLRVGTRCVGRRRQSAG